MRMRAVVQRVLQASVTVDDETTGAIGAGLLVYLGVGHGDDEATVQLMAKKVSGLRIFSGEDERMTESVLDVGGDVLVVSQFTLYGDVRKGRRPSFTAAGEPERARQLYLDFVRALEAAGVKHVATGRFAADMRVASIGAGPVTILIDTDKTF